MDNKIRNEQLTKRKEIEEFLELLYFKNISNESENYAQDVYIWNNIKIHLNNICNIDGVYSMNVFKYNIKIFDLYSDKISLDEFKSLILFLTRKRTITTNKVLNLIDDENTIRSIYDYMDSIGVRPMNRFRYAYSKDWIYLIYHDNIIYGISKTQIPKLFKEEDLISKECSSLVKELDNYIDRISIKENIFKELESMSFKKVKDTKLQQVFVYKNKINLIFKESKVLLQLPNKDVVDFKINKSLIKEITLWFKENM